jgi:hypothetical protein
MRQEDAADRSREQPRWLHEIADPAAPEPFSSEAGLRMSWERLQNMHTSFRATEQREYQALLRRLWDLERLFLERPQLRWYYEECLQPEYGPRSVPEEGSSTGATWETDQIVALQAQLMEDVYESLQLERFANAPDNRGWVNLLRRWGRSSTFNLRFNTLRVTFNREFVEFYDQYLRMYPLTIDESPVPHPWDPPARRIDPRDEAGELLPGVFLDSGLREVGTARRAGRSGQRPLPQPGAGGHGIADAKGGYQGYEQPAPPPTRTDNGDASA